MTWTRPNPTIDGTDPRPTLGLSTYRLNGFCQGDEHPAYTPSEHGTPLSFKVQKSLTSHTPLSFNRLVRNDLCKFMHNFTSLKSADIRLSFLQAVLVTFMTRHNSENSELKACYGRSKSFKVIKIGTIMQSNANNAISCTLVDNVKQVVSPTVSEILRRKSRKSSLSPLYQPYSLV